MNYIFNIALLLIFSNCFFYTTSYASGMAVFLNGAKELSMANAVIAHSEGTATNYFNPALLTKMDDGIELTVTAIDFDIDYDDQMNEIKSKTDNPVYYPATLFMSYQLHDNLTLGLGINSPYGLGVHWPDDWAGRYLAIDSELETLLINPNIALKINEQLSIAVGFDILYATAELSKAISFSSFGLSDGVQKFEGDDIDVSYNLAVHYDINEQFSLGLSYRYRFDLTLEGKAKHTLPTPELSPIFPNTKGDAEFTLPSQLLIGLAYKPTDKLLTEFALRWENWSDYKSLDFSFSQSIAGNSKQSLDKNWRNTIAYLLGVKYQLSDTLALSGGVLIDNNPIPNRTFDPVQPASDKTMISLGLQKQFKTLNVSVAYAKSFYEDRTKNNAIGDMTGYPANGEYSRDSQMLSFSLSYLL